MRTLTCTALLFLGATSASAAPAPLPLTFVEDLPLPGNATRFDYQSIDAANRRLYIAHLGDSSVVVFDLDAKKVIHEVPVVRRDVGDA